MESLNRSGIHPQGKNPIQVIQDEALELAGMTHEEAFAIDRSNIALVVESRIFMALAESFYRRVYGDLTHPYR